MIKIPTAEEFLIENKVVGMTNLSTDIMIEFAKLHVETALKEASENAETELIKYTDDYEINKHSILNAYPLENIK